MNSSNPKKKKNIYITSGWVKKKKKNADTLRWMSYMYKVLKKENYNR